MIFFAALERVLQQVFTDAPREQRRALLVSVLEQWGIARQPASLCAESVLAKNDERSPGQAAANARRVVGSWVQGQQQGMAAALLVTRKETWRFKDDLTYEHKVETHEGYSSPFGSSYSLPKSRTEAGVWAPTDWDSDRIDLFIMQFDGAARRLPLEWTERGSLKNSACTILGSRFGREW